MQKTQSEITATAIYTVTTKATGAECYAVPSDSNPGTYYVTCWNAAASNWTCTCKHGEVMAQAGKSAHCKHTRAAQTAILANKNAERERKEAERQAYLEYEAACGTYNHPWA